MKSDYEKKMVSPLVWYMWQQEGALNIIQKSVSHEAEAEKKPIQIPLEHLTIEKKPAIKTATKRKYTRTNWEEKILTCLYEKNKAATIIAVEIGLSHACTLGYLHNLLRRGSVQQLKRQCQQQWQLTQEERLRRGDKEILAKMHENYAKEGRLVETKKGGDE